MDLSIAIVSWNTRDLLDQCLKSIFETTMGIDFEVIVVDNASSDNSMEMVRRKYPQVTVIENKDNVGFPKANNQAFQVSTGRYFLLLNPDTICHDRSLTGLTEFLDDHQKAGAVGPLVLNSDKTMQYSWAKFPTVWNELLGRLDRRIDNADYPQTVSAARYMGPFKVDWVGGCCLMIRREAVEQIGLMDESFFMYCEETDWCYRLHKAGWQVCVNPDYEIIHLGGQSSKQINGKSQSILINSKAAYFMKHHGWFSGAILRIALLLKLRAKVLLIHDSIP